MNYSPKTIFFSLLLVVIGVGIAYSVSSPSSSETTTTGQTKASPTVATPAVGSSTSAYAIQVTDGRKHSIPLEDILDGGPGKDGIPSIDKPQFVSVEESRSWLPEDAQGIGVDINGESRFYPYAILVWHEIVNDKIGDQPLLVTYCPLCKTGIVFDPTIGDTTFEFGVSGKLWQSNLLMYNRTEKPENETLWSQVLGEGVVGPLTGKELDIIPSTITRLADWRSSHPDTKVLARPKDSNRNYNRDPYKGYYESSRVSFGAEFDDDRLHPKTIVHGLTVNGTPKAYPDDRLSIGTSTDTVAGTQIEIRKFRDGTVRFTDTNGNAIDHVTGFWFSWATVHPESDIYSQSN